METVDRYTEWLEGLRCCIYKRKVATQVAISASSGIAKEHLNAILKGRGKRAGENRQDRLSKAVGMSYDDLRSLGRWVLAEKDEKEWVPPIHADGKFAEPLHQVSGSGDVWSPPQGEEVDAASRASQIDNLHADVKEWVRDEYGEGAEHAYIGDFYERFPEFRDWMIKKRKEGGDMDALPARKVSNFDK